MASNIISNHRFCVRRPPNRFSFDIVTRCTVAAAPEELAAIFAEGDGVAGWWPGAFLRAETISGRASVPGQVLRFHTKGIMPHTFQFMAEIEEADLPYRHRSRISGDFVGRTTITTEPEEHGLCLTFLWQVEVRKKGLRPLTPLIRWLLIGNHLYAMFVGAKGLEYELTRRRAAHSGGVAQIAPPPQPAFPHNLAIVRRLYGWRADIAGPTPTRETT